MLAEKAALAKSAKTDKCFNLTPKHKTQNLMNSTFYEFIKYSVIEIHARKIYFIKPKKNIK